MTDDFWKDRFHGCALAAGFIAAAEGRLQDSEYVRTLAYRLFEQGARFPTPPDSLSSKQRAGEQQQEAHEAPPQARPGSPLRGAAAIIPGVRAGWPPSPPRTGDRGDKQQQAGGRPGRRPKDSNT